MKRSQINRILKVAQQMLDLCQFRLPPWSTWKPDQWRTVGEAGREIFEAQLGWDITDFGSANFPERGLSLFTLRNGLPQGRSKPYAEKIMVVGVGQETPAHFHFQKTEDIINRGGGTLVLQLWNSTPGGDTDDTEVTVKVDGVSRTIGAGGLVRLVPGESICLETRVYHRFFGEGDTVLVGEVSEVNDDHADNRFLVPVGRFPVIEEDEAPWRLLVSDYTAWV